MMEANSMNSLKRMILSRIDSDARRLPQDGRTDARSHALTTATINELRRNNKATAAFKTASHVCVSDLHVSYAYITCFY